MRRALLFATLLLTPLAAHANVTVPGIFNNNMVLQRDTKVPVWGKAAPGEKCSEPFERFGDAGRVRATDNTDAADGCDGKRGHATHLTISICRFKARGIFVYWVAASNHCKKRDSVH